MAFYYLLRLQDLEPSKAYYHCIGETIRPSGDSDTNAAIVGGLIGAALGV